MTGRLVTSIVLLLLASNGSHAMTPLAPSELCRQLRDTGIFNEMSMSCFPWLAQEVSGALCRTNVTRYHDHSALGFGPGAAIYDITFYSLSEIEELDVEARRNYFQKFSLAMGAWRHAGACEITGPVYQSDIEPPSVWNEVYEKLPATLYGPWRECWEFFRSASSAEILQGSAVRCLAMGAFDLGGEDGIVSLEVDSGPEHLFDGRTRLTEDLETEGVDCDGKSWRKGKRLRNVPGKNVLHCRRLGRSAVRFRAVTEKGTCEAALPELTEPRPWQELCGSTPTC